MTQTDKTIPRKRVKTWFRRNPTGRASGQSLKAFARSITGAEVQIVAKWLRNKKGGAR